MITRNSSKASSSSGYETTPPGWTGVLSVLQHFPVQLSHHSLYARRTLLDMLVPAPAAMTHPDQTNTILDPGANSASTTLMEYSTDLTAISRRHAPVRWPYNAETRAALDDAATAAKGKGKTSKNPSLISKAKSPFLA